MPKTRTMSLTQELVDLCFRVEPKAAPLFDDDHRRLAERVDREAGTEPLWAFAYGSLIWKAAFVAVESKPATAFGWHRTFSLRMKRYRGSPAIPGLMMALSRGGRCDGLIYRMADENRLASIEAVLRREMDDEFGASTMRFIAVRTEHGVTRALGCWIGARGPLIAEGLAFDEVADASPERAAMLGRMPSISSTRSIWSRPESTTAIFGVCKSLLPTG